MNSTTDRELLELAAKAVGYEIRWCKNYPMGGCYMNKVMPEPPEPYSKELHWNPLTDDGDALRLAIKLRIGVSPGSTDQDTCAIASWESIDNSLFEEYKGDPYTATRRAIVRAAAEIGKGM